MRALLGFGFILALAPVAASATIINYSFETPSTATEAYSPTGAGVGWTFTSGSGAGIAAQGGDFIASAIAPPDGTQAAFIQTGVESFGLSNGTFSQTITGLTAGDQYSLSFYTALRSTMSGGVAMQSSGGAAFDVTAAGTDLGTYTPTSINFLQTTTAGTFTAAGDGTALLAFTGITSAAELNTLIDDVVATDVSSAAVPEPATLLILGVGLLGLWMAGRAKSDLPI